MQLKLLFTHYTSLIKFNMNGQKLLVPHVKKSSGSAGRISRTELSWTPDKHPKRVSIYQSLEVRKSGHYVHGVLLELPGPIMDRIIPGCFVCWL